MNYQLRRMDGITQTIILGKELDTIIDALEFWAWSKDEGKGAENKTELSARLRKVRK